MANCDCPDGWEVKCVLLSCNRKPLTIFMCGSNHNCDHDFRGWREFSDGSGGETVCTKCGMGALHHSLWSGE